ncbi:hypothetical protein M378DRAFT_165383, partial [Amanita muscaria Koide BX008]
MRLSKKVLVFLWAMEKVYFDAWSNVNKGLSAVAETNEAKQCVARGCTLGRQLELPPVC